MRKWPQENCSNYVIFINAGAFSKRFFYKIYYFGQVTLYLVHPEIPHQPTSSLTPQHFLLLFFCQKSRGRPSFSGK